MKTFLIATDFSAASRNATQYGIALAKAFNGRVILVNAYQQVPVTVTEPLIFVAPDMGALATQKLEEEADFSISENATPVEYWPRKAQTHFARKKDHYSHAGYTGEYFLQKPKGHSPC